jgi:lysozyme
MTTDIIVIDVSHHQAWPAGKEYPWDDMAAAGIVGVILKATEGVSYVDDTFRGRYDACIEHGVAVCAYHFLRHGKIADQMASFLNVVRPRQGERMVLDWEDSSVTLSELKQAIEILLEQDADIQVTVYGSASFIQTYVPNRADDVLAKTSLWVARYSSEEPYWPSAVWPTWSLWQCTDSHYGPNGYGPLDGNQFNGSVEACVRWLGPAGAEPGPEPDPDEKQVVVDITADDGVTVIVNVNGDTISSTTARA